MTYRHVPVLFEEVMAGLAVRPDGVYLDCTFGRGGHSRGILDRLGENGRLYACDRDPEAIACARQISDERFAVCKASFSELPEVLAHWGIAGRLDGILMDLGISSPQVDDPARGFSFMHDGPLDMRMDPTRGATAADLVNGADVGELTRIFREYGEERQAGRVARALVARRERQPFARTLDLAEVIASAVGGPPGPRHKATRCFQALRIAVNAEFDELRAALETAVSALRAGGRLLVVTFHSLEDRQVKDFIRDKSTGQKVPGRLPLTTEQLQAIRHRTACLQQTSGAIKAGEAELGVNPRARSATLRIAQRI